MPVHDLSEFSASELLWHYCVLWVSYSHGFCPSNRFCWRFQIHDAAVQQQFLGISGKCSASQNSCVQSHWSAAVSACRISIAKLLKHSHFQVDTTVHFQKSWRSLQNLLTDIPVLVKEIVSRANMDTCSLAKKNVDFQTALSAIQGRGDASFCVMPTRGMQWRVTQQHGLSSAGSTRHWLRGWGLISSVQCRTRLAPPATY